MHHREIQFADPIASARQLYPLGGLEALSAIVAGAIPQPPIGETMGFATLQFSVSLTRPISRETGRVVCDGRVLHRGETAATAEATLVDARGKLLAHGTATCALMPRG